MRVAVLSDIHANLPALEAVLDEPDVVAADAVVLLGDIALGPMPAETLDRLAELGDRAGWGHGNREREVITAVAGGAVPRPPRRRCRGERGPDRPGAPGPAGRAAARRRPGHRRSRAHPVLPCLPAARRRDAARRQPAGTLGCGAGRRRSGRRGL